MRVITVAAAALVAGYGYLLVREINRVRKAHKRKK